MANQTVKWTDKSIKALKPAKSRYVAWSKAGNGQGVRVATSGRKSFVFMYRFNGTPRMMTLGQYQAVGDLADCNTRHGQAVKKLEKGIDPGALLVQQKKEHRESDSFAELAAMYLAVQRRGKKGKPARERTWKEVERIFSTYINPKFGDIKAQDVSRDDVRKVISPLVAEGKAAMANRVLSWIRSVIKFGLGQGFLDPKHFNDPTAYLKGGGEEEERTRELSEAEIRALWSLADEPFKNELPSDRGRQSLRLALRLLLVTGQRGLDVAEARWQEFDGNWWTIPASRYKTRHDQRVALSPTAMTVLEAARSIYPASDYLFSEGKPLGVNAMSKAVAAYEKKHPGKLQQQGAGDTWVPKDIRRTVATLLGELDHDPIEIDRLVMGHLPDKIARTYNLSRYNNPRRKLWTAWDTDLHRILRGEPRPEPDEQQTATITQIGA